MKIYRVVHPVEYQHEHDIFPPCLHHFFSHWQCDTAMSLFSILQTTTEITFKAFLWRLISVDRKRVGDPFGVSARLALPPPSHQNPSRRWTFQRFQCSCHRSHLPHVQTQAGSDFLTLYLPRGVFYSSCGINDDGAV